MATPVTVAEYSADGQPIYGKGPYLYGGNLFTLWIDFDTANWCASKSTDSAASWSTISTTGPLAKKSDINFVGSPRLWNVAAVLDGTTVHIFYPKAVTGTVCHATFDLSSETWGAEDDSGEYLGGPTVPTFTHGYAPLAACLAAPGRCFVAYQGWDAIALDMYLTHMFYDGGWGAPNQYTDQLGYGLGLGVAANSARIHLVFWRYNLATPSISHYAIALDGSTISARTLLAGTGGGVTDSYAGVVHTWDYSGTLYFGLTYQNDNDLFTFVGVSHDTPSVTSKIAYTKISDENTSHGFFHVFVCVGASLHLIHQRYLLTSDGTRVYSTCIPMADYFSATPWGTSTLVASMNTSGSWAPSSQIGHFISGSAFTSVHSPSAVNSLGGAENGFVRSVSFLLASCAPCCCFDYGY